MRSSSRASADRPATPLRSLDDALATVAGSAARLPNEAVGLDAALGRALADDAVAPGSVQPFDNSAMDGFAVRSGDGTMLRLAGESRAGAPAERPLEAGEAYRISTGAVLPVGADAVVPVELTTVDGDRVRLDAPVDPGANVRRAGEDFAAGDLLIGAGTRIGSGELAVLATAGIAQPTCVRRPRVSLMATGDELVQPGEALAPGQIHASNVIALAALTVEAGGEAAGRLHAPDDPSAVADALERTLVDTEIAIVCGGVSVGEHDHVKRALAAAGVVELFWRIALKPGKPTWFGRRDGTLVFGLPGNPVSAIVCFELLVRAAIDRMLGLDPARRSSRARLAEPYSKRPGRAEAARCRIRAGEGGQVATLARDQGSHVVTSMLDADALAILDADAGELPAGTEVSVVSLGPG